MIRRRTFLTSTAAALALPRVAGAGAQVLRAGPSTHQIAPEAYPATDVWAFGDSIPGPTLTVPQGGRLTRRFENALPQPSSVHWHGIRLPNRMDGVPGLTQDPVRPGDGFHYDFVCPDAGTYWYHSHLKAVEQVERGLAGPLIVTETEAPDVDADHVIMLDDWRLDDEAQIMGGFDNGHDLSHAGRMGNVVTANGQMELRLDAVPGQRLRLRLINAANARVFTLGLHNMRGWIMATDGMPLATPRPVGSAMTLAPAQRLDLFVDIEGSSGDEAVLTDIFQGEAYAQVVFRLAGAAVEARAAPTPLPANPDSAPASAEPRDIELRMEGGAMRWLASARHEGQATDGRTLASEGLFWALNGDAGRPQSPFFQAGQGDVLRIAFVNETVFDHAMHLHGHHFHELGENGAPGDFRDTTLVPAQSTRRILMTARNPGDWLLHCHMLGHHSAGMGTWFRVT
jgi:FtsP/CotA-like multicopper oxidase with cupredoxin domain